VFYPEVYSTFLSQKMTLPALKRSYPEWHKGRERYYVWCVDVDSKEVLDRFNNSKKKYQHFIVNPYHRKAHITVAAVGFLSEEKLYNDDITVADINQHISTINKANLSPFQLHVGSVNSFQSAPFIEVANPSHELGLLRDLLLNNHNDFRSVDYIPHITLGIYNAEYCVDDIGIDGACLSPLMLDVSALNLYSYDAFDIGSELRLENSVCFKN